ncbi:hypothetical protein ABT009_43870 [Streptomyces sp. NPDC002896]|uniref:hypothetical protein n=1 Tax=Streptomyces sp. NPDC002896 TaxID=3154438 RepID=UPI003328A2A8
MDGAKCFSLVRHADHSSKWAGVHCHGYSFANSRNRRISRSLGSIVSSFSPRDFCWARQPRSIASNIASSGRNWTTPETSSMRADPARATFC